MSQQSTIVRVFAALAPAVIMLATAWNGITYNGVSERARPLREKGGTAQRRVAW